MPNRPEAAQPAPGPAPQSQGAPDQGGGNDPAAQMQELVLGVDKAIAQIASVIGGQNPEAGKALEQVGQMFRDAITQAIEAGRGGGQPQPSRPQESGPVSAQAGGSANAKPMGMG